MSLIWIEWFFKSVYIFGIYWWNGAVASEIIYLIYWTVANYTNVSCGSYSIPFFRIFLTCLESSTCWILTFYYNYFNKLTGVFMLTPEIFLSDSIEDSY
jgi:hypothetical protein